MFVYKTINKINNKIYIGQSSKAENIFYLGSGKILLKAIKKYGKDSFDRTIIENCDCKDNLNIKEKYWISYYNSTDRNIGYNISIGGSGGNLGEKVNRKLSKIAKDSNRMNGNTLRKGKAPWNKGKPMSEEQKVKLRKPKSEEHKKKMSETRKGKNTKPIICLNNNKKFNSIKDAAKCLDLTEPNVIAVLKGRAKKTKGYSFKYI